MWSVKIVLGQKNSDINGNNRRSSGFKKGAQDGDKAVSTFSSSSRSLVDFLEFYKHMAVGLPRLACLKYVDNVEKFHSRDELICVSAIITLVTAIYARRERQMGWRPW